MAEDPAKLRIEAMKTEKFQSVELVRRLEAQMVEATFLRAQAKCIPPHLCALRQPHEVAQPAAAVQISITDKTLPERYLLMIVNNQMNYR